MVNKIEEIRKEKKITQEELARKINISLSQLRNIEKGRTANPSIEVCIKIKRALDIKDIEELFIIEE